MSEQSSESQRHSFPAAGAVPGEDDMLVAPDAAMASPGEAAGDPQQVDPGGHPHAPSADVPRIRTDAAGGAPPGDVMQPETPAGPGEHNAQTEPDDEDERRRKGSA